MRAFDLTLHHLPAAPSEGDSYFWDAPLLPAEEQSGAHPYPMGTYVGDDGEEHVFPLQFIASLRLDDLPPSALPAKGLLQLWGAVDYFLGYESPLYYGLGWWPEGAIVARFTPQLPAEGSLVRTNPFDEEGTIPPHSVTFTPSDASSDMGFRLLGEPFEEEVRQEIEGTDWTLLLQLDSEESKHFDLQFHDMGLLYVFIERQRLQAGDFSRLRAFMTSM